MFAKWKRNRAIRNFIKKLPSLLAQRYGADDYYSTGQIETTLNAYGFSEKFRGYAFVFGLSPEAAAEYLGNTDLAETMRQEIADLCFKGRTTFTARVNWRMHDGNMSNNSMSEYGIGGGSGGTFD